MFMKIQLVTSSVTVQLLDMLSPGCGGGHREGFLKITPYQAGCHGMACAFWCRTTEWFPPLLVSHRMKKQTNKQKRPEIPRRRNKISRWRRQTAHRLETHSAYLQQVTGLGRQVHGNTTGHWSVVARTVIHEMRLDSLEDVGTIRSGHLHPPIPQSLIHLMSSFLLHCVNLR